jgi:hypothetical protein
VLEEIAKQFAQHRGINLQPYKSGIMGYQDPFTVWRSLRGRKEKLFVKKQFPPSPDIFESGIYVLAAPGGKEGILTVTVINGCLKDYLALLQGAQDNLSKALYQSLSGYLDGGKEPFTVIREQLIGVNLNDVSTLLPRFYPH